MPHFQHHNKQQVKCDIPWCQHRLWTTEQTKERLGLATKDTLAVWRVNGRYPELKWTTMGRRILYWECSIESFLSANTK